MNWGCSVFRLSASCVHVLVLLKKKTSFLTYDLHIPTLQKEQLEVKESRGGRGSSGMTEDEVFSKVASLFKGQEDLLAEFGQFLPDAKRSLVSQNTKSGHWKKKKFLPNYLHTDSVTFCFLSGLISSHQNSVCN